MKELSLKESERKAKEILGHFDWRDTKELVPSMVGFVMECQAAGIKQGVGERVLDEARSLSTLSKEEWAAKILESCILFLRFVSDVQKGWKPNPEYN